MNETLENLLGDAVYPGFPEIPADSLVAEPILDLAAANASDK